MISLGGGQVHKASVQIPRDPFKPSNTIQATLSPLHHPDLGQTVYVGLLESAATDAASHDKKHKGDEHAHGAHADKAPTASVLEESKKN